MTRSFWRARCVWSSVLVGTGVAAGAVGIVITLLLHAVQHAAFGYTESSFLIGVEQASALRRVVALLLAGAIVGSGWWLLRARARIVSVTDALTDPAARLPFWSTTVDAGLQIVAVGMGASLGREGAPRQVSAAIGGWLSDRAHLSSEQRRIVIAAGAGAGLAAVYNVPLGGALFTCEVLLGSWSWRVLLPAAAVSAVATVCSWAVLPNRPIYQLGHIPLTGSLVFFAIVVGPICGVAGRAFTALTTWARSRQPHSWHLPIACIITLTCLGGLAIAYPQVLGNGKGPTQVALDGSIGLATAAALIVLKPIATAACLRAGIGGGLLTPALATGALLGLTAGHLWRDLWPNAALGGCVLVAAAATLATTQRAPLCAIALAMEFTHPGAAALLPVLAAVATATIAASWLPAPRRNAPIAVDASARLQPTAAGLTQSINRGKEHAVTNIEDRAKTIDDISGRLSQKHPTVQPDTIAAAVEQTYAEYDGRPIRDFVPVLVERAVSENLRTA